MFFTDHEMTQLIESASKANKKDISEEGKKEGHANNPLENTSTKDSGEEV